MKVLLFRGLVLVVFIVTLVSFRNTFRELTILLNQGNNLAQVPVSITVSASISPETVYPGASAVLSWSSTNATSCVLDVGGPINITNQPTSGTYTVSPLKSMNYVVKCISKELSKVAVVPVVVSSATVTLSASPTSIAPGASSDLTWSTTNATSCTASGDWTGRKEVSGKKVVTPTVNSTYILTCSDADGGSVSQSVSVSIAPPTVTLSASPTSIAPGASSDLTWSTTNATSCTASNGWTGTKGISGTQSVSPGVTTTYTLDCVGVGGSANGVRSVAVVPVPVSSKFKIGDGVQTSSSLNVRSTPGITEGTIAGKQPLGAFGTVIGGPTVASSNTWWNIDYVNSPDGWSTEGYLAKTTITPPLPNQPTLSFYPNPTSIAPGSSSDFTWSTTNATSCTASGGWTGTKGTSGTQSVSPTVTTTYTMTCTGSQGSVTKSVNVSIQSVGGPIILPTLPLTFQVPMPTQTGQVISVPAGDANAFKQALTNAQLGDTIELQAGSTYNGSFTFPNKTIGSGWVVVRSSAYANLPASGIRVSPSDAVNMPKLVSPGANSPTIIFAPGANHYRLIGLEVTLPTTLTYIHNVIVDISSTGSLATMPNNITFDRTYIHAQPTNNIQRCIHADGAYIAVVDSYLSDCHGKGIDSQAIAIWGGSGPFKFVNNRLEGAGENIIFGGSDPAITNVIPSDAEIRGNYIYTPIAWKGTLTSTGGTSLWTKKNLFETKNARRILLEGNVLDGSWGDGQVGNAFVLKSSNQGGKCTWCQATDLTIRYNVIRNSGGAVNISGTSGANNNPLGGLTSRILIENNLFENIGVDPYTGVARLLELYNNAQDVIFRNNTVNTTGYIQHLISAGSQNPNVTNFEYKDNVAPFGYYGVTPGFSEATLANSISGSYNYSGNVVYGNQNRFTQSKYPNTVSVADYATALSRGIGANLSAVLSATAKAVLGR